MISLLQRVTHACVHINDEKVARIGQGLLVLNGFEPDDDERVLRRMLERLLAYRVFPDDAGRMNRSLLDISGELLLVPQFTLAADTRSGNRPGFSTAAAPELGQRLFERFLAIARQELPEIQCGKFGADMQVSLTNDGPVTFWLHVH